MSTTSEHNCQLKIDFESRTVDIYGCMSMFNELGSTVVVVEDGNVSVVGVIKMCVSHTNL